MPSAAARRIFEDQIPPFMSVFDLDAETMVDRDTVTIVNPRLVGTDPKDPTLQSHEQGVLNHNVLHSEPAHKHNDSASTQMTESADSSPTTTMSTTDSSPLSDPSPSSSPDSPISLIPLNNYPSASFGGPLIEPLATNTAAEFGSSLERPMTSPGLRRPRNMKGLSIQPPVVASTITTTMASEPASPVFIKPKIPAMRRKPSQLSLKTNSNDLMSRPMALEVPPSPAMAPIMQRRALKHSLSSPHMLSTIKSSTFGPSGGMTLPNMLERNESGLSEVLRPMKTSMNTTFDASITEEDSPIRQQVVNRMDVEPYHEQENNEDQKTPGYPDGPIAIYEDNVFLYLEPTAEEAGRFDTVINVAREVRNPFTQLEQQRARRAPFVSDLSPIPDTAITERSFATAFESQPAEHIETPTTPKASNHFSNPEYIHMLWDHNTDIAPDLTHLCELIENRTKQGKKVLIHCQQGASRSASLIIAYGLWRKPELSVNDAYYAAQSKSQWISPNMKLMYSLQDFHRDLSKKRLPSSSTYKPRSGRSPTKHRLTLSADAIETPMKDPRTAPLPGEDGQNENLRIPHLETRPRGNSSPGGHVSPGPASAPPHFSWKEEMEQKTLERLTSASRPEVAEVALPGRPKFATEQTTPARVPTIALAPTPSPPVLNFSRKIDRMSQPPPPTPGFGPPAGFGFQSMNLPLFSKPSLESLDRSSMWGRDHKLESSPAPAPASTYPEDSAMVSPRAEAMTSNPFHDASSVAGMRFDQPPPMEEDGLFSPRATMFPRDPAFPFGRALQVADPRSPPTMGETPIVRSIDDIL
jgi:tyrosine-protein phosphatase